MNFQLSTTKKLKTNLMSKNFNAIIVVAGEPKSVFLELYLKSFNKFKHTPLLLVSNYKLLSDQMKLLKIKKLIRIINKDKKIDFQKLNNKRINLVDIPLDYKNLKKIDIKKTNIHIKECFNFANALLKKIKN